MSKLKDKVAIVTGASKGIGASIAKHFAAEGASVVVNYSSSKEGAERVVTDIKNAGGKAIAVQANVAKKSDIDRLFAEAKTAFGRLDILVNNAGVYEFLPLEGVTEEHFHKHFNLNVLGLIMATQKAVESFGSNGGSIINISSVVGVAPVAGGSVYCASKAAVHFAAMCMRHQLAPLRIRVVEVLPPVVDTDLSKNSPVAKMPVAVFAKKFLSRLSKGENVMNIGQTAGLEKFSRFFPSMAFKMLNKQ